MCSSDLGQGAGRPHGALQLLERPHLDLAHALAADAVLLRQVLERRRVLLQTALFQDVPLALVEAGHGFHQQCVAHARLFCLGDSLVLQGRIVLQHVLPLALAFLGGYFLLFTISSWIGDPAHYVEVYRQPDLHAALYFGFFMVTDPPTSPPRAKEQLIFGAITAVVCYAFFQLIGLVYFLSAGLMIANAWEAWRRVRAHSERERLKVHDTRHPHPV